MQKYEYTLLYVGRDDTPEDASERVDALAKEGWRLHSSAVLSVSDIVHTIPASAVLLIFERPTIVQPT